MNKALIIARHEFLTNIRRKEFILMTVGMPLFILGIMILPVVLSGQALPKSQKIGYIDETGSFEFPEEYEIVIEREAEFGFHQEPPIRAPASKYEFIEYGNEQEAKEALLNKKIASYFIIPENYMETGEIFSYSLRKGFSAASSSRAINSVMVESLLKSRVDEKTVERVKKPANVKSFTLNEKGVVTEKGFLSFLVPFVFVFLLIMSIFMSSNFLLQGVVEEKENRIMEILVSSVSPQVLLTGKILGLGGVGLVQIAVWMFIGIIPASFILASLVISFSTVALAFVYFILGFLLYASMMAGIGAISSSLREGQQMAAAFSITAVIPAMFMGILFEDPNSIFAKALSYFPLTSPVTMMIRSSLVTIPLYEILLSVAILLISIHIIIKISAKVFRMGMLMYGKRPSLREIARYLREG